MRKTPKKTLYRRLTKYWGRSITGIDIIKCDSAGIPKQKARQKLPGFLPYKKIIPLFIDR
jgi:hypothetical protein